MDLRFRENGIAFWLRVTNEADVRLYALGRERDAAPEKGEWFRAAQAQLTGAGTCLHHGCKLAGTLPGGCMKHVETRDARNRYGRKIEVEQAADGLTVVNHYQFYDGVPVVRAWAEAIGRGAEAALEYLPSLALTGLLPPENPRDREAVVHIPHNTWCGEAQWKRQTLGELGWDPVHAEGSMKRVSIKNTGSWACAEHLPMGGFSGRDGRDTYLWQIETSGSWHWEISDVAGQMYLQLSGPNWQENGWLKVLKRGERFESVRCALAFVKGGTFEDAVQAMTRYRRLIRRPNLDNASPSVIFNDYMNCLDGDPTTAREYPLIEAAGKLGCRYYCVDAGWYSDGPWWDGVGEWLPSKARFPGGLKEMLDGIRAHGMIPGLWLELEVMGIKCPLAQKLPDDWFFTRGGRRVVDEGRYQLDYSNSEVRAYADGIIDRLVREYGAGYIKMDYNINAGVGTERGGVNAADGLLRHTRAYLDWLDGVFERYPELVVENCSSGGMRMEYGLLSRHSIQSVSDQTDYLKMARIACNCMTAVAPEQAAIWSYPLRNGDEEEACFNMVNAMLLRIHQSGHLAEIGGDRLRLIREGVEAHLSIVQELKEGLPFWPTGLADFSKAVFSAGVDCGENRYLAVWNAGDRAEEIEIPLGREDECASVFYPVSLSRRFCKEGEKLVVALAARTAVVMKLEGQGGKHP